MSYAGRRRDLYPIPKLKKHKPKMVVTGQADTHSIEIDAGLLKFKKERTTFKNVPPRVNKRLTA